MARQSMQSIRSFDSKFPTLKACSDYRNVFTRLPCQKLQSKGTTFEEAHYFFNPKLHPVCDRPHWNGRNNRPIASRVGVSAPKTLLGRFRVSKSKECLFRYLPYSKPICRHLHAHPTEAVRRHESRESRNKDHISTTNQV